MCFRQWFLLSVIRDDNLHLEFQPGNQEISVLKMSSDQHRYIREMRYIKSNVLFGYFWGWLDKFNLMYCFGNHIFISDTNIYFYYILTLLKVFINILGLASVFSWCFNSRFTLHWSYGFIFIHLLLHVDFARKIHKNLDPLIFSPANDMS